MGTLSNVAQAIEGHLEGADRSFDSISTDTRTIGPGQLFFALKQGPGQGRRRRIRNNRSIRLIAQALIA